MTLTLRTSRRDHPRIRGEHTSRCSEKSLTPGSSPHTRGAHRDIVHVGPPPRIIPAYAGSTFGNASVPTQWGDHPRIRGEHDCGVMVIAGTDGSSPHTRGAPAPGFSIRPGAGIIPAYAGSTLSSP